MSYKTIWHSYYESPFTDEEIKMQGNKVNFLKCRC